MKHKKNRTLFFIVFAAALAVFLFAAVKLGFIFWGYYEEDSVYKELESFADIEKMETSETTDAPYVSPIDFPSLLEQNSDTVAWIYFENMDINYPIVQGEDDDFYLHHGFFKEENNCGCIFLDSESAPDFTSDNSFVYGHNMKNKSMFAKLNQYEEEDFYKDNKTFLIFTPTQTMRYEIYSCYPAELGSDSFTYRFEDLPSYENWQTAVKSRSLYDTGITPDSSQKTVTLMTCTPRGGNYRFLVHARRIE